MGAKNYRDLIAWQKALDLVKFTYEATAKFPREEIYALTSQMRRAAVSIPSNIAEGQGRGAAREFAHFLGIASGSLKELETQFFIAERLGYADRSAVATFLASADEVGRLIRGLSKAVKRKLS